MSSSRKRPVRVSFQAVCGRTTACCRLGTGLTGRRTSPSAMFDRQHRITGLSRLIRTAATPQDAGKTPLAGRLDDRILAHHHADERATFYQVFGILRVEGTRNPPPVARRLRILPVRWWHWLPSARLRRSCCPALPAQPPDAGCAHSGRNCTSCCCTGYQWANMFGAVPWKMGLVFPAGCPYHKEASHLIWRLKRARKVDLLKTVKKLTVSTGMYTLVAKFMSQSTRRRPAVVTVVLLNSAKPILQIKAMIAGFELRATMIAYVWRRHLFWRHASSSSCCRSGFLLCFFGLLERAGAARGVSSAR